MGCVYREVRYGAFLAVNRLVPGQDIRNPTARAVAIVVTGLVETERELRRGLALSFLSVDKRRPQSKGWGDWGLSPSLNATRPLRIKKRVGGHCYPVAF
jgi:hypothetical protein